MKTILPTIFLLYLALLSSCGADPVSSPREVQGLGKPVREQAVGPIDLRGYGKISAEGKLWAAAGGDVSLVRFQAEDEALPEAHKTGRVIWLERLDRNTTLEAFAACDVFVLSADHEALPIAMLEAMREAKPWISRDVGCISQLPGGVCVRSESAMTRQMGIFAATPGMRATLGQQGRDSVEKIYNSKHYVDSYCDLVVEIAGRSHQ